MAQSMSTMSDWIEQGRIHYHEQCIEGLEQAPEALIGLLKSRNFGKVVIRIGADH
mgnify:CR=1 FL=1